MFRDQVADALRAVCVTSPTSFAWFGRPSPRLKRAVRSQLAPPAARQYLVARLEQELYGSFYLRGLPRPQSPHDGLADGADAVFVAALSAANAGTGGWGHRWRVVEVSEDGAVVAERDGLRLRIDAADHRPAADGPLAPGAFVSARLPKEMRTVSPGFYFARGDADGAGDPAAIEVRLYFNLTQAGAVPLLAAATRLLNEQRFAFSIKLVNHPGRYSRCDAGVLYLEDGAFARARPALRALVKLCAPHLRIETPALTKPLAPGVGIGEHRAELGTSFGIGRCRLIAEGIADAYEQRLTKLTDRVDAVARSFARSGMELDLPYLVSGARDDYVL
ncbi:MAG TPA: T3SS effector HopA1 family protein [Solirubrobacteraceae bacterium]